MPVSTRPKKIGRKLLQTKEAIARREKYAKKYRWGPSAKMREASSKYYRKNAEALKEYSRNYRAMTKKK